MCAKRDEREESEEGLDEGLSPDLGEGEREQKEDASEGSGFAAERAARDAVHEKDARGGGERRGEAKREGRKPESLHAQKMKPVEERRLSIICVEEPFVDGVEEIAFAEHLPRCGAIEALIPIAKGLFAKPRDKAREGDEGEQDRVE